MNEAQQTGGLAFVRFRLFSLGETKKGWHGRIFQKVRFDYGPTHLVNFQNKQSKNSEAHESTTKNKNVDVRDVKMHGLFWMYKPIAELYGILHLLPRCGGKIYRELRPKFMEYAGDKWLAKGRRDLLQGRAGGVENGSME